MQTVGAAAAFVGKGTEAAMKFADEESRIVELIAQERELSGISYAELGRRLGIDRKRM